ncbi:tRNA nucleotidyltransferase (CCA-adding enzyme) [Marinilactibacillus piezotolerans]|uniref:CCA-adding enzyme n=1 Tax=Marinilactibacillus piezotolerans TaxID=258723 RepID=A0A1I3V5U2_9LACT|nr:CCA tRNA nucleotidyltransferase [Marinilactibacillus piezotolerans]SFJ90510.1 tRNA nucleotidyltransferase (CCA-adding enzyme) [Marinilactibacillus piezotolerans]
MVNNRIELNKVFIDALPVLDKLNTAGFEAYFVGGSVRDALLGKEVNDVDIATSAFPLEVKHLFKKTIDVGIEHGTVMILSGNNSYEITTFRTESTYQDFRRPDSVTFVRSLKEDLKRRDFTINALAMDREGIIHDYFKGKEDLKSRLIKAVGIPDERFNEDALRMLRATRFASQLDFEIEENTVNAIKKHARLLEHIAMERIQIEFVKMLLGRSKNKGLIYFIETDLYVYCPGLDRQGLEGLINIEEDFENELQIWVSYLLLSSLKFNQHRGFLRSWKLSNKMIQDIEIVYNTIQERLHKQINVKTVYKVGINLSLETEKVLDLLGYPSNLGLVESTYNSLPIYSKKELAVSGSDLLKLTDHNAGKWLGDLLEQIEQAVLDKEIENDYSQILEWITDKQLIPEQKEI